MRLAKVQKGSSRHVPMKKWRRMLLALTWYQLVRTTFSKGRNSPNRWSRIDRYSTTGPFYRMLVSVKFSLDENVIVLPVSRFMRFLTTPILTQIRIFSQEHAVPILRAGTKHYFPFTFWRRRGVVPSFVLF